MDILPIVERNGDLVNLSDQYSFITASDKAVFDDFVLLASQVCATPMAIISLFFKDSLIFSSSIGLQSDLVTYNIANHSNTLRQEDIFVVEDTLLDSNFAENPLVRGDPKVRFLACVPLHNLENYRLGMLCVMDVVPRRLTTNQLKALEILKQKILHNLEAWRDRKLLEETKLERHKVEIALQRSMDTNRALLTVMPDVMFRISSEGVFVNYKAPLEETTFLTPEECLGKKLSEVLPQNIANSMLECVQKALATHKIQILEYQMTVKEALRYFEGRFVISDTNEVILIIREITERKQAEEDIYKALVKEKELGELKNRFITMISHEFRTPLTTILSSAELLEYYGQKWGEDKRGDYFKQIYNSVGNMTYLLDDILLIGRAESKGLHFNPTTIYLYTFCLDLIRNFREGAGSRHNFIFSPNVSQQADFYAMLDENLLHQILSNLISNAVKYSPPGSTINLELDLENGYVVFRVIDNGIGIPNEGLNHLYNPFYRGSNIGTVSGTGLGLAIVKNAVDLHQGIIQVQSEKGFGTTFTVKIPHGKAAEEKSEEIK
jgi:PAS domain S-box-containing protein